MNIKICNSLPLNTSIASNAENPFHSVPCVPNVCEKPTFPEALLSLPATKKKNSGFYKNDILTQPRSGKSPACRRRRIQQRWILFSLEDSLSYYFKNPLIICASASASVSPSVISLINCSPAILPMAAS